jgi:RNA polymerase sigma factor (sigma-70 family)
MTAVASWDIAGPTDAELARAAAGGDREAFAGIYDRYADRLHDFCVGMLRDCDGAADCVQDAFCTAATRLSQLREPDKLRPWLYAIARNEALRRLRERRRETPSDEVPDTVSNAPGPETLAARTELAELIAEAAGGLTDRDRSVLELAYRHGLDGPELAEALGVNAINANKIAYRLRETIERSLGALLVSRRAQNTSDGCPELATILDGWDGQFTVLMRKRISRHIESCPACDDERRRMVSPAALLGATPIFIPAPAWLRDRTLGDIRLDSLATPVDPSAENDSVSGDSGHAENNGTAVQPIDKASGRERLLLPVALFAAALIASLGLTLAWVFKPNNAIIPTDISGQTVTPSKPLPTPTTAPAAALLPPPQAPAQTPAAVTPPNPPPADPPPGDNETPVYEPTPEVLPPYPPAPPDPVEPRDRPSLERSAPPGFPPPPKPPMSFRPTVVVTPAVPPPGGDNDSDSDPPDRPPGTRG